MGKQKATIQRITNEIDAAEKTLGRLATHIATLLRGKHKPTFQPHIDAGDTVVVHNARNLKLTGQKLAQKVYYHYSGYPGGLKTKKASVLMQDNPAEILRYSVYQMLPDNRLRKAMIKRLRIYND